MGTPRGWALRALPAVADAISRPPPQRLEPPGRWRTRGRAGSDERPRRGWPGKELGRDGGEFQREHWRPGAAASRLRGGPRGDPEAPEGAPGRERGGRGRGGGGAQLSDPAPHQGPQLSHRPACVGAAPSARTHSARLELLPVLPGLPGQPPRPSAPPRDRVSAPSCGFPGAPRPEGAARLLAGPRRLLPAGGLRGRQTPAEREHLLERWRHARAHTHTQRRCTHRFIGRHTPPPEPLIWGARSRRPANPRKEPFPGPGRPLVAGACPQARPLTLRAPQS